ncbi:hypothetical protein WISP_84394 [Willisornis vidua]|uniref:Endonuclease/exonuclease/phosphatase domain-containing protein n=1 Tax=Willisornis vidua TaxID=1566151 RepID=A0ABQ9D9E5_9PASS|nr:hypothetical protein WISP_84394 [Willisornis vidua]
MKHVLFSVYAPTLQADPVEKEKFYTDLHRLTQKVPADDKIIILGDFNARAEAAELFGLKVSLKKTEVLYQPAPQEVFYHPHISIGESELNQSSSSPIWEVSFPLMAGVTSIEAMLKRTQLRWAGHISRMEDHRLPKIVNSSLAATSEEPRRGHTRTP